MTSRPHHKLLAWTEAMALVRIVYEATCSFPKEETYGLGAQLRQAAISIPSNLAEGAARNSRREFHYFLGIARGSLSELETQLLIAADLGYLSAEHQAFAALERVSRLVSGLHKKMATAA
jgi:four helix bundle protein